MYLYFDKQGNLKEQINDEGIRQGNQNINKLYIFWEDAENRNTLGVWYRFVSSASDGFIIPKNVQTPIKMSNTTVTETIPYDPKRDLKYFKYNQSYKFYVVDFENDEDVLNYGDVSWLASIWFVVDKNDDPEDNQITITDGEVISYDDSAIDVIGMGAVCFFVAGVVQTIVGDENISLAQWNYLIGLYTTWEQHQHDLDDKITELDTKVTELEGTVDLVTPRIEALESAITTKIDEVKLNGVTQAKSLLDNKVIVSLDLSAYATNLNLKTYAKSLEVTINQSTYVATFNLKDADGNIISTQTLDFPIESMVVSGSYDNQTKSIILTLQNGNTTSIPVGDLVDGLASQTDLNALITRVTTLETNSAFNKANFINLYFAKGGLDLQAYDLSMDFSKLKDNVGGSNLKAKLDNIAFTYNSITDEYEAKGDINMKGLDIDGVTELISGDIHTANLYGLDNVNNGDILLRNDIDGNQQTIKDIYLETPSITLTPPEDSSAFIWVGDESILSVDENQNVIIGSDNAGSLTLCTQNTEIDVDDIANKQDLAFTYNSINDNYTANSSLDLDGYDISGATIIDSGRFTTDGSVEINGEYNHRYYGHTLETKEIDSVNQIGELQLQSTKNTFTLFSVVAPTTQPKEATITTKVENSGANNDETYFMDITTMNYGNVDEEPEESIYLQSRNASVKPRFNIGWTDETQTRHKKLIINPDALPMMFTSTGIWVKNTNDPTVHGWANRTEVDLRDINANKTAIASINTALDNKVDKRTSSNEAHLYAYGVLDGGAINDMTASKESYNGTIPIRDGSVGIKSNTIDSQASSYDSILVNIEWIKNHAALLQPDGDNQNYDNSIYQIYGHMPLQTAQGSRNALEYCFNVSNTPSQATIPQYDSNGNLKSSTPVANNDVATKQYVDNHSPSITPELLAYTQNSGIGNLQFNFDVDLTTKQGLGVFTYGNCNILINLYGLTVGTTYYQNCIYRKSGSTTTTGLRNGMLSYSYYNAGNNVMRLTINLYTINSDGTIGSIDTSATQYTAYLFLVNLK